MASAWEEPVGASPTIENIEWERCRDRQEETTILHKRVFGESSKPPVRLGGDVGAETFAVKVKQVHNEPEEPEEEDPSYQDSYGSAQWETFPQFDSLDELRKAGQMEQHKNDIPGQAQFRGRGGQPRGGGQVRGAGQNQGFGQGSPLVAEEDIVAEAISEEQAVIEVRAEEVIGARETAKVTALPDRTGV